MGEHRIIADLMLAQGHAEEAGRVLVRALDVNAQDIPFFTAAVLALRDAGHPAEAQRLLAAAVERNPLAERINAVLSTPPSPAPAAQAPPPTAPPAAPTAAAAAAGRGGRGADPRPGRGAGRARRPVRSTAGERAAAGRRRAASRRGAAAPPSRRSRSRSRASSRSRPARGRRQLPRRRRRRGHCRSSRRRSTSNGPSPTSSRRRRRRCASTPSRSSAPRRRSSRRRLPSATTTWWPRPRCSPSTASRSAPSSACARPSSAIRGISARTLSW